MIDNYKLTKGVLQDTELNAGDWEGLINNFKKLIKEKTNKNFPQDVDEQLFGAINAVFLSWESKRARTYRKLNQIPEDWGTAVNVQSMVFGNMGNDCATGVAFTRNPSTGENKFFGEYLINAQGEDVVAGSRTPRYITKRAKGLPAPPGAASGKVVFTADEAERMQNQKEDTILVRVETSPEDIHGMHASKGILTARGGMTSHAAVVARGMGRPCVSGSAEINIDYESKEFKVGDLVIKEGDTITIDGGSGRVMQGVVPTVKPDISGYFSTIMKWADDFRKLKIRTNSETPQDTKVARSFGAEGIGLCRTEHMFFEEERILSVRQMIVSKDLDGRKVALEKLLPHQKNDFKEIFKIMKGLPVTVRLLDPPLHEFLPKTDKDMEDLARSLNLGVKEIKDRVAELHELNPMLGHRGCRLGISFPEIYEMQCKAIFTALIECKKEKVQSIIPEIMIPLVSTEDELGIMRKLVNKVADKVQKENKIKINYFVGTMINFYFIFFLNFISYPFN